MSSPTAIIFTTHTLKTLVDSTVRLTIDVEPNYAIDVMRLFGKKGTAGAMALLNPNVAQAEQRREFVKGGPLSREAAGLCKREDFQEFVVCRRGYRQNSLSEEDNAAAYIRDRCCITSRAELDHALGAAQEFNHIKGEFLRWKP